MPRLELLDVKDGASRVRVGCEYDDAETLHILRMGVQVIGRTRRVGLSSGDRARTWELAAGTYIRDVSDRNWFLTRGEEGELIPPFSAQVF